MSKRSLSSTAAVAAVLLSLSLAGAPAASATTVEHAPAVAAAPYVQVEKGPQPVFWERLCRMLRLCD